MTLFRDDKGSAMMISLVILLMLGIIGIAAVQNSNTDMDIAENYQTDMKSFYVAEAGAELAYTTLRDTAAWRTGFADYPFAGGSFTVSLVDSLTQPALDDTVLIYSTGKRSDAVTRLEVKLAPHRPFDWGAHGDDDLIACGGTGTDSYNADSGSYVATKLLAGGNLGSNGPVDVCGTSDIYGGVATSLPGELDIDGGALVTGDTTSLAPEIFYPPVPQEDFDYAVANNAAPIGLSGDFKYNPSANSLTVLPGRTAVLESGTYYFESISNSGNITLAPGAQVTIYLDGDIKMVAGSTVNSGGKPRDLLIKAGPGNINLAAGTEIVAAMYAPESDFNLTGQAQLYGSFIMNSVSDTGGSKFHYDRSLREMDLPGDYVKVAWREL